jgi:hypothetical protein
MVCVYSDDQHRPPQGSSESTGNYFIPEPIDHSSCSTFSQDTERLRRWKILERGQNVFGPKEQVTNAGARDQRQTLLPTRAGTHEASWHRRRETEEPVSRSCNQRAHPDCHCRWQTRTTQEYSGRGLSTIRRESHNG